jgi:hypothetical protein
MPLQIFEQIAKVGVYDRLPIVCSETRFEVLNGLKQAALLLGEQSRKMLTIRMPRIALEQRIQRPLRCDEISRLKGGKRQTKRIAAHQRVSGLYRMRCGRSASSPRRFL